jgi:predicted alpha/beta-fold hydrolase
VNFQPFWGLASPKLQTIIAAKLPCRKIVADYQHIELPDGDCLAIAISKPAGWQRHMPTVMALHGLCGSHDTSYMRRIGAMVMDLGHRFIGVNLRGCGIGKGLAKGLSHAGRSEDILSIVQHISKQTPDSPLAMVGFSLGGNIALKLVGELAEQAQAYFKGVIAITPPVDLARCADLIKHPTNKIFRRHFIAHLWRFVTHRHQLFPELGPAPKANMSFGFWEFDDCYTSLHSGFSSAKEYYQQSSAITVLPKIQLPCKLLFAKDDPFIDCTAVQRCALPASVELVMPEHGGHMGFLAAPQSGRPLRWMDYKINAWLQEFFGQQPI